MESIKIPVDIMESMILMCEQIDFDIENISSNDDLNNSSSSEYSIKLANQLILITLQNFLKYRVDNDEIKN
jgi:hypothetical protein